MELEAILTQKGVKYYGVVRAYSGELDFWGMRSHAFGRPEYMAKKVTMGEVGQITLKDPNKITVDYRNGNSDVFEVIPSKLTSVQRAFLKEHMQQTVTESRELSPVELSKALDRMCMFLSQKTSTTNLLIRKKDNNLGETANKIYVAGMIAIVGIIVIVFFGAVGVVISKLL